jgi:uncharacterized membrane protein YcaP (DUF421 family)
VIRHDLFVMGISPGEKVLRTVGVYVGLAVLLRLAGKRDLAQLSTFDLVVMLLLSNVLQNAVIGEDNSLASDRLGRLTVGSPTVLVRDGRYLDDVLRREGVRRADLERALHNQGADNVGEVRLAMLNPGGAIVVELEDRDQNASRGDLAALRADVDAKLDRILATLATSSGPGEHGG